MNTPTPDQILAHWTNRSQLVDEEVQRIKELLYARNEGSPLPVHFNWGVFTITFEAPDQAFLEEVAKRFTDAGWEAEVKSRGSMGRRSSFELVLGSTLFSAMPEVKISRGA